MSPKMTHSKDQKRRMGSVIFVFSEFTDLSGADCPVSTWHRTIQEFYAEIINR